MSILNRKTAVPFDPTKRNFFLKAGQGLVATVALTKTGMRMLQLFGEGKSGVKTSGIVSSLQQDSTKTQAHEIIERSYTLSRTQLNYYLGKDENNRKFEAATALDQGKVAEYTGKEKAIGVNEKDMLAVTFIGEMLVIVFPKGIIARWVNDSGLDKDDSMPLLFTATSAEIRPDGTISVKLGKEGEPGYKDKGFSVELGEKHQPKITALRGGTADEKN
jgi:hypothetical protein